MDHFLEICGAIILIFLIWFIMMIWIALWFALIASVLLEMSFSSAWHVAWEETAWLAIFSVPSTLIIANKL
jgi:hypothetical protein